MPERKPLSIAIYRRGVPTTDPIGIASLPCAPADVPALLRDDPALISELLLCDIFPWHVASV
jgi:hypothetical protein